MLKAAYFAEANINIEYPIDVSPQLRGDLDYYLHGRHHVLVVEAKQSDLTRGFTQLAVELIELDQWTIVTDTLLYGVVTTGDIWQFGCFHRKEKQIYQDLTLYRAPTDLEGLMQILVGILR